MSKTTIEQHKKALRELREFLVKQTNGVGPMHANWEYIMDIDCLLNNKPEQCLMLSFNEPDKQDETPYCSWAYMGLACRYTGKLLECDHTFEDCNRHGNIQNFCSNPFQALTKKAEEVEE